MFVSLLQFGSESEQLEWAKRESEREERERLRRLQLQEQRDLELAIALSKTTMPNTWAGVLQHNFLSSSLFLTARRLQARENSTIIGPTWLASPVTNLCKSPVFLQLWLYLCSNDSTFSYQLRFIAPKLCGNYNQGRYGATWFKPCFILQEHGDLTQAKPAGYSTTTTYI